MIFLFLGFINKINCQTDLKLIAKTYGDTILMGSSSKIILELQGIDYNFQLENKNSSDSTLRNFLTRGKSNKVFRLEFLVTPNKLGINEIEPFVINILGHEIKSNSLKIYTIKRKLEKVDILMPEKAKLNEKIKIKILNYSQSDYDLEIKELDFLKVVNQSQSTTLLNGEYTRTITLVAIVTQKGEFRIDKKSFKTTPEYVNIEPVKITIE